ncbi:hypothetical protein HYU96_03360 [Candidatus Daviesbacteria bacterium]|nr:hypothetical protein [Candidatus Daviesbacteria bacterium]
MDKNQILQLIKTASSQKLISREELEVAYEEGMDIKRDYATTHHLSIIEVLYYIGGFIVFLGIAILIFQNWFTLNTFARLLATLGAGIAAYIVGVVFGRSKKLDPVGQAFHLIAALVMPIGLFVLLDTLNLKISSSANQTLLSAILFLAYIVSYFIYKKTIFIIFSIIFGTWLFFAFTNFLIGNNPLLKSFKLNEYKVLLTGLTYALLGYFFSKTENKRLSSPLYGFGVLGFLGAALALGGWSPQQNIFWELVFPGIVFGVIFLSVYLRSTSFLTFGTIYLMAYILKITSEYFSKSLGWPLSLVLAGLGLILIGFVAFNIHKKYLLDG